MGNVIKLATDRPPGKRLFQGLYREVSTAVLCPIPAEPQYKTREPGSVSMCETTLRMLMLVLKERKWNVAAYSTVGVWSFAYGRKHVTFMNEWLTYFC